MIYRIYYDNKKHKFAARVKNREELMALRNAQQNLDNLDKVRKGDQTAKPNLLQLAYNIGHVEGALAGCKSIGSFFFHDVDCYENEECRVKGVDFVEEGRDRSEDAGAKCQWWVAPGVSAYSRHDDSGEPSARGYHLTAGNGYQCERLAARGFLDQWFGG